MATGTSISAVTSANLTMSFRSQYVTASLNEKAKAMPRGVVRGFNIVPGANPDEVDLLVDDIQSDSVMNAVGILNNKIHAITYRVDTTVTLDLSGLTDTGGVLYYIAFVPNYTIGATTDGSWRAYTETEFENGDIETDGGVFLFSIYLPDVDAIPLLTDIMVSGQSSTTFKSFMREDQHDFVRDGGGKSRVLALNWVPMPIDAAVTDGFVNGTWDESDHIIGRGSIALATGGGSLTDRIEENYIPLWTDTTDAKRQKLVVQYWYKTDGTYAGAYGVDVDFRDDEGAVIANASGENSASRARTYRVPPAVDSGGWKLLRYEITVPNPSDHGGSKSVTANLTSIGSVTTGTFKMGGLQVWVESEKSSEPGYHSYSGEGVGIQLLSRLTLQDRPYSKTTAGLYWNLVASSDDLDWEPRPITGTAAREIRWGSTSYGGNQRYRFAGDDTSGSYVWFQDLNELRHSGTGNLLLRGSGGSDDAGFDAHHIQQTDDFTYSSGSSGSVTGDTPTVRTLYAGSQAKAWGVVDSDGAGAYGVDKGLNISDITNNAFAFRVTLKTAMADANYSVACIAEGTVPRYATVASRTTTTFDIHVFDLSGSLLDVANVAIRVMFVVMGEN